MDTRQSSGDTASEPAAQIGRRAEGDTVTSAAEAAGGSGATQPEAISRAVAPGEEWRIGFLGGGTFAFSRYINGTPDEVYRTVDLATAAVWAGAIIQGFQPPRSLISAETARRPPDAIGVQSAGSSRSAESIAALIRRRGECPDQVFKEMAEDRRRLEESGVFIPVGKAPSSTRGSSPEEVFKELAEDHRRLEELIFSRGQSPSMKCRGSRGIALMFPTVRVRWSKLKARIRGLGG